MKPGGTLVVMGGGAPTSPSVMSTGTLGTIAPEQEQAAASLVSWSLPVAPADPNKTRKLRQRLGQGAVAPEQRPHVQDVLDKFIPPKEWTDATGTRWAQHASTAPASRLDTVVLGEELNRRLLEARACPTGIDPARRVLYQECFTELIRQVTTESVERGILLQKIREERDMTIKAYEGILESKAGYAFRIALKGEKDYYRIKTRIEELRNRKAELVEEEARLKAEELRVRAEGEETFKDDERSRKEEIATLQKETTLKKAQLEAITNIPKK